MIIIIIRKRIVFIEWSNMFFIISMILNFASGPLLFVIRSHISEVKTKYHLGTFESFRIRDLLTVMNDIFFISPIISFSSTFWNGFSNFLCGFSWLLVFRNSLDISGFGFIRWSTLKYYISFTLWIFFGRKRDVSGRALLVSVCT